MKRALLVAATLTLAACDEFLPQTPDGGTGVDVAIRRAPSDLPAYFDCLRDRGFTAVSAHGGSLYFQGIDCDAGHFDGYDATFDHTRTRQLSDRRYSAFAWSSCCETCGCH